MSRSSARRPVTIRHKEPDSTQHSTARLPDGTWLLHYKEKTGKLFEIACVSGGKGFEVCKAELAQQRQVDFCWENPSYWHVAVPPGVRLHAVVATFVAAAQLGVVDLTLLGTLECGPWVN